MSRVVAGRALKSLLAVAISATIIALLVAKVDIGRAKALLVGADVGWLAVAFVGTAVLIPIRGWRFHIACPIAPPATIAAAIGVQTLINRVAPMRLGELSLPYLLHRSSDADPGRALVSLALIRIIEVATTLGLLGAAMLLRGELDSSVSLLAVVALLSFALLVLARFRVVMAWGTRAATAVARWTRADRVGVVARGLESLSRASAESQALPMARRLALLALSVLALLLQIAVFFAILASVGIHVGPLALAQASCVTAIGLIAPIPTVGSVGTLEASWAAGFVWVGLSLEVAITTGIATQLVTLLSTAILAAPCWWLWRAAVNRRGR